MCEGKVTMLCTVCTICLLNQIYIVFLDCALAHMPCEHIILFLKTNYPTARCGALLCGIISCIAGILIRKYHSNKQNKAL